jgi:hypothetical protein
LQWARRQSTLRERSINAANAGGMGPETVVALQQLLQVLSSDPAGLLIAASDADTAGRRHAGPPGGTEAAARFAAILPPEGLNDWNDALRALSRQRNAGSHPSFF